MPPNNSNNKSNATAKLKYVKEEGYNTHNIDGALVSGNLGGKVVVNFYSDRFVLPESATLKLEPSTGKVLSEEPSINKSAVPFERVFKTSVETNLDTLKRLMSVFISHIDQMEREQERVNKMEREGR